jgi:hypothetical protein
MKFRSDLAGSISAVRFYKGPSNIGAHVGNLWTLTGTKLASVNFSGETSSGWQQASFSSPVPISANTTYIVSYYSPNGWYADDLQYFGTAGVDRAPLHALSNGTDGANGVYIYATGGGFPTDTYNSTNYWVDVVFVTANVSTWSISGTITGGAGATVKLTGTSTGTVTADASGVYTFTSVANGTYTVTPSKNGFTFTPTNRTVTVNGANVSSIDFTAQAVATWSISGTISGGAGATVNLTGTSTAIATADASGVYTFTSLANGTYTVTPSKAGFTFTPTNRAVTVNGANVSSIDFTAQAVATWSITGSITGGAGATVNLTGTSTGTVTADGSGVYTFPSVANGTYTVTPSKTGFTFTPANRTVTVNGASVSGIDFTAQGTPPPTGIAIDVNTSTDRTTAGTTVTSPMFSTTVGNELLLAFVATDQISGTAVTVRAVSGAGLTWTLVRRTNVQRGTSEIWRAFAPTAVSNVSLIATVSQSVVSSITVMSFSGVDTSGTNGSGAIGATAGTNAATGAPTASLVTTRNNSWVFGVGNDYDNPIQRTPGPNQSLVHQFLTPTGDTYWVQKQNSSTPVSGTVVTINDTAPTTDRYNLTICEIRPSP